jgi:hypothetical protein
MRKWIRAYILAQISWMNFSHSYPEFNNELFFADFGTVGNQNISLRPES